MEHRGTGRGTEGRLLADKAGEEAREIFLIVAAVGLVKMLEHHGKKVGGVRGSFGDRGVGLAAVGAGGQKLTHGIQTGQHGRNAAQGTVSASVILQGIAASGGVFIVSVPPSKAGMVA